MAKRKAQRKKNVSKGLVPNVNGKLLNTIRHERKASPSDLLKSEAKKDLTLRKPQNDKERELGKRYRKEKETNTEASKLYNRFSDAGVTWAGCVQAVKTNFTEQFMDKWNKKLKEVRRKNPRNGNFSLAKVTNA